MKELEEEEKTDDVLFGRKGGLLKKFIFDEERTLPLLSR